METDIRMGRRRWTWGGRGGGKEKEMEKDVEMGRDREVNMGRTWGDYGAGRRVGH